MKIPGMPGEYAFKALVNIGGVRKAFTFDGDTSYWKLSDGFYFSLEEAKEHLGHNVSIKWPVEVQDGQVVYVPSEEELK